MLACRDGNGRGGRKGRKSQKTAGNVVARASNHKGIRMTVIVVVHKGVTVGEEQPRVGWALTSELITRILRATKKSD